MHPACNAHASTQVVDRAARRGYALPSSFMSSKPDAGINHKEFGVTSEGVAVFLHEALHLLLTMAILTEAHACDGTAYCRSCSKVHASTCTMLY